MVLKNPKRAIWEALLLAIFVFFIGFSMGLAFESFQTKKMNEYFVNSEFYLMDAIALNSLENEGIFDCEALYDSYFLFADRVYQEAVLLEEYEVSQKITKETKIIHRRYDLLRTFLWANILKNKDRCENSSKAVVYLYEYDTNDLVQKATQNVWSKVLLDLKKEQGENIILIPIAVDMEISSLNTVLNYFNISNYPVVIIDNKFIVKELVSVEELKKYLN